MNCDEALKILTEPNHHQHQEALEFVVQEPSCFARVDQFARAILSDLEEETTCAEAQIHLPQYYELEQGGQDCSAQLPIIHNHLARCPYCQTDYEMLRDAMQALDEINTQADSSKLEEQTPVFDLSFLTSDSASPSFASTATDEIWRLQNGVQRLFDTIRITVAETSALIADMGAQLQPQTILAPVRRGKDDVEYSVLHFPDTSAQIRFKLDAIPARNGKATIVMKIFETDSEQPIQNVRVTLRRANNELVAGSLSDQAGAVEFSMLDADGYNIEMQFDGNTWEIPVTISLK